MSNPGRGRAAPTNPFYSNPTAGSATPPPTYQSSASQPQQYSSLADLTRGRAAQAPQQYDYQPQPERQGYRTQFPEVTSNSSAAGRRVPPLPQEGMMPRVPDAPPRRNVRQSATPPPAPSRPTGSSATSGFSSYIPAGASTAAASAGERVRDGINSIATQQRKDQVLSGIGKLGAGAAKLTAKGVYQVGKFASK